MEDWGAFGADPEWKELRFSPACGAHPAGG